MPEPKENPQSNALKDALSKLPPSSSSKKGLSTNFLSKVKTPEEALKMCENAMQTLANEYIKELTHVKEAKNEHKLLEALEKGETLWEENSSIIKHFDHEGSQIKFLMEMRHQYIPILEKQLADHASVQTPTPENKAARLAIIGVIDRIWKELGKNEDHPVRKNLQLLAKNLK